MQAEGATWIVESESKEVFRDKTGNEMGHIFRKKDEDGDWHWYYSFKGEVRAANTKRVAVIRLEESVRRNKVFSHV